MTIATDRDLRDLSNDTTKALNLMAQWETLTMEERLRILEERFGNAGKVEVE